MGDFRNAAECHLAGGNLKEALSCYRSIPDLDSALTLVSEIGDHPAAESLRWIARAQQLLAERPEKFTKTVTAAEKKFLQELLERGLGVSRRAPVPKTAKKTAKKKAPAPRKRSPRKPLDNENYF